MSSHNSMSLPAIKLFMVERNAYMIDISSRTIMKRGAEPLKFKLPAVSQRQSLVAIRERPKAMKRDPLMENIRKILDYKSPQYTLKRILEKKVKTVSFL